MENNVTIVGAGPAGSTAAYFISSKGFNVTLIDKQKFPRDKPCGGGLPNHVLKRFGNLISDDMIESHTYGGTTYSPTLKYKLEYKSDKPFNTMVLRKKFDHGLVKKAVNQGVKFIDGKKVLDIQISKDKAMVILDTGTKINSDIIIGADGMRSLTAKKLGFRDKNQPRGFGVVEEYELDESIMDKYFNKPRLGYLHSKLFDLIGYGWVFPKKRHVNIGVGEILYNPQKNKKTHNLKEYYKRYLSLLKKQKLIPESIKIKKIMGGALPVYPLKKTYGDRVILVGDAGGFIDSLSGEGIYYAMSSGEIAAETVEKALLKKDTSEKMLSDFQKNWKKDFGKDLRLINILSERQRTSKMSEKNFSLVNKDEKLKKLILNVFSGNISLSEYKWKILRRYIYCYIKDIFEK